MESYNYMRSSTSAPIEIPRRRHHSLRAGSPYERSISPDLIFEMSPVSPDFPSSRSAFGDDPAQDPFMYSFPKLSPHRIHHAKPRRRHLPLQCSPQSSNNHSLASNPTTTEYLRPNRLNNDDEDLAPPLTYSSTTINKTPSSSTVKIVGFTPLTPISVDGPPRKPKTKRLSPPPRSSSYSSSPWILAGRSDDQPGKSCSLDTDSMSFEFERHLMRRIENQNPRRFRKISLSSTRV